MKIISGIYKGRTLKTEKLLRAGLKPTSSYHKQVLFSLLAHNKHVFTDINDKVVCDLFCGTGSVGFEMLSRGASYCYFVDFHKETSVLINQNIQDIGISNASFVWSKLPNSVNIKAKIDILYMDPPYNQVDVIFQTLKSSFSELLQDDCMIILEHDSGNVDIINKNMATLGYKVKLNYIVKKATAFTFVMK